MIFCYTFGYYLDGYGCGRFNLSDGFDGFYWGLSCVVVCLTFFGGINNIYLLYVWCINDVKSHKHLKNIKYLFLNDFKDYYFCILF